MHFFQQNASKARRKLALPLCQIRSGVSGPLQSHTSQPYRHPILVSFLPISTSTEDFLTQVQQIPAFLRDDNINEKMEYKTQLKHFKAMFQREQVVSSKITHAPRGLSVRHAKDNG
jgi:hypothetical protein